MRRLIFVSFLLILIPFIGSVQAQQPFNLAGIDNQAVGNRYFLILDAGRWIAKREGSLNNENTEQVIVRIDRTKGADIYLSAVTPMRSGRQDEKLSICTYGLAQKNSRTESGYTVCNSAFTSNVAPTGGSGNKAFTLQSYVGLAKEKLFTAVKSSGLLELIEEDRRLAYQQSFGKAENISALQGWLAVYEGKYDPDALAPAAREKIALISAGQQLESYRSGYTNATTSLAMERFIRYIERTSYDPDNLIDTARRRYQELSQAELKAQTEEEDRKAAILKEEKKRIAQFRRRLKVGDQTNVGPIVEIKGNLHKIYRPVENFGSEHWIRLDQLFPLEYLWHFSHGTYVPPEPQGELLPATYRISSSEKATKAK